MPSLTRMCEAGKDAEADASRSDDDLIRSSLKSKFARVMLNQRVYSQYFKLVVIFAIAVIHVFYARHFLEVFREFEEFIMLAKSRAPEANDVVKTSFLHDLLVDYKKNLWISVSAMCACLSATSFFLLLLREEAYQPTYLLIMRIIDAIVFMALPALLYARSLLVRAMIAHADECLIEGTKYADPSAMMNHMHCSITTRENVPLCSSFLERSIFPVVLLEYLVILCLITAAYVGLAYVIVYCIKHWFPHDEKANEIRSVERHCHKPSSRRPPPSYKAAPLRPLLHPYYPLPRDQLP